jgi:hypothetical protein
MISQYKQWVIGILVGVFGALLGVAITLLTWQYPKSPANSPSVSDYERAASTAVESYFKRAKFEEIEKKYVRSFTLTSKPSEGFVDTGIVLQRNRKIFIRRQGEEDGTVHSSNFWAVLTNEWDSDKGIYRSISDRWDDGTGSGEIATNDILGSKQRDTLKLAAYWENQDEITVDVIVDYDKYLEEYPYPSE